MIEVEIKVQVTEDQKQKLLYDAELLSAQALTDIYYDSDDFSLTTRGMWLRERNELFELKMPATKTGGFNINKNIPMHEFNDKDEIARLLNLHECYQQSFHRAIEIAGYKQLYKLKSTRQTYKKNKYMIVFDYTDFGDLTYCFCEIETMVKDKDQAQAALKDLYFFVEQFGISTDRAEGKLWYYIKQKNPAHYQALELAGEAR